MDLEYRIKCYLQINDYKPNYLWKAQNYLNGFLVKLPDYCGETMRDFQRLMSYYCELGYFNLVHGIAELPDYRLTEKGYQIIIMNQMEETES